MERLIDNTAPALVCIISASRDKELREALENHLTLLVRQKRICIWNRQQIPPGTDILQALATQFAHASVILLLMSADFIAECPVEIELITSRPTSATVIPILLRAVDLQGTPFERLQCLPRNGQSIADSQSHDQALQAVADEIRKVILSKNPAQRKTKNGDDPPPILRENFDHLIVTHTQFFAGREDIISSIHKYIDENRSGYIFIEGLSGYGKTSLLAKIVQDHPEFAYHFISQVYRTYGSDFHPTELEWLMLNLCEQLEHDDGEQIVSPKTLKARFHLLLRTPSPNKAKIIIIDGVDEIDRHPNYLYGLLPTHLPPGVFILFSARKLGGRNYLTEIGLTSRNIQLHIDLPGLDANAIQQLLGKGGGLATQYFNNEAFIQGLYSVSEGDPFYLRFLIEDVAEGTLRPDNLTSIPSGLAEYLDMQLSVLDRSAYLPQQRDILGLVIKGFGPLSKYELITMVDGLDGMNFDNVIRDIRRFLLGYNDMFSLCHRRFKEYFLQKMDKIGYD